MEFLQLIAFFILFKAYDIYVATWFLMVASGGFLAFSYLTRRHIAPSQQITTVSILAFGGLTVLFKDATFIQYKPSVVYLCFSLALLLTPHLSHKASALQALLGSQLKLPLTYWRRLDWQWAGFFVGLAALNLYVASAYSLDTWVNFKLFGTLSLTLLFILLQSLIIRPHLQTGAHHE